VTKIVAAFARPPAAPQDGSSATISSRSSVVVSETRQSLKPVPAMTAHGLASVRETTCSPRDQIARPQNAILSEFESPHRSCGRRHPTVSRGVAQPGRAPGSGPGGRRFKSSLPDQLLLDQLLASCEDRNEHLAMRQGVGFREISLPSY
jgi:hypothetical protein